MYQQPPAQILNHNHQLYENQGLNSGQYINNSKNQFYLTMQQDGNLVMYKSPSFQPQDAIWSSNTYGKGQGPYQAIVQPDGNFVVYDRNRTPTWASNTYQKGQGPYHLALQDDRNLVLYDRNKTATWSSNTYIPPHEQQSQPSYPQQQGFNTAPGQQFNHAPGQQFNHAPGQQFNHAPGQQFNHAPGQQFNQAPGQQFNQAPGQQFNHPPHHQQQQHHQHQHKGGVDIKLGPIHFNIGGHSNKPKGKHVHSNGKVTQNHSIKSGQYTQSPNHKFYLTVQDDGNMVLYSDPSFQSQHAFWSSNTYGKGQGPYEAIVQKDGNFVLYDRNKSPIWASDTWNKGQGPYHLALQSDRNLVLYDRHNTPTWSSNTWQQQ